MTPDLLLAVERLRIANVHKMDESEGIDDILSQPRPKKRIQRDHQAVKKELERTILTPQTSFDGEWLNKLQQYVVQSRGPRISLTCLMDDGTCPQITLGYTN